MFPPLLPWRKSSVVSYDPIKFIIQTLTLVCCVLIILMEVTDSVSIPFVVLIARGWRKVEDVTATDDIQDFLLWGVEGGKGGVIHSYDLTLAILLPWVVRFCRFHTHGLLGANDEATVRPLAIVVSSLVTAHFSTIVTLV